MPNNGPTTGQVTLLLLAIGLYAVGGLVSLVRLRGEKPALHVSVDPGRGDPVMRALL